MTRSRTNPRLLSRSARAKEWFRAKLKALGPSLGTVKSKTPRLTLEQLKRLDDALYSKDFTRRKINRYKRVAILALFLTPYVFLFSLAIWAFRFHLSLNDIILALSIISRDLVQSVTNIGAWLNVPYPGEFATYLAAEAVAFISGTIVVRAFSRGPRIIEPKLEHFPIYAKVGKDGARSYWLTISNYGGETGAMACEATMLLDGIEERDVLDIEGAKFNQTNFTEYIEVPLKWVDGRTIMTLRSGQQDDVELLRFVTANTVTEAHFEVPSSESSFKSTICLRLKTFYPKVMVSPMNGRHVTRTYTIGLDRTTDEWGFV